MKKCICLLLLSLMIFLAACTEQAGTIDTTGTIETTETTGTAGAGESPGIFVKTPMTISDNPVRWNESNASLRLKMTEGKYEEDWNPGALMGTIWEGGFLFELSDEAGNTIARTDLSKYYTGPLTFTDRFQLAFDDYNHDGNKDFTLGQYGSSNGNFYRLFTLNPDGTVAELKLEGASELFISASSGPYSILLEKQDNASFRTTYYDNSQGKTFESVYEWKSDRFVKASTREILPLEGYYEILSDPSLPPAEMLQYVKKNAGRAKPEDAAALLLRLELLQRNYLESVAERYYEAPVLNELAVLYQGKVQPEVEKEIKNTKLTELLSEIRRNGLKPETAEASVYFVIDYGIYTEFGKYLPGDIRDYFSLMAAESDRKPANDGGLVISWEEAANRALAQERFLLAWPRSQKLDEVKALYQKYVSFLFNGLPNTPDFSYKDKKMAPELKECLLKIAGRKGDTPLERAIAEYVLLLDESGFKASEKVNGFRKSAVENLQK